MKEEELIELIKGWQNKEANATQVLFGIAYHKIKELAEKHREKIPDNANTAILAQSATDLAHDVYIRLSKVESTLPIETLREFYGYLNATVRNAFIDNYRKLVETRSRNPEHTQLTSASALKQVGGAIDDSSELSSMSLHIEILGKEFPRQAETLELRYYAGRSNKEIARLQNISIRTVENDLRFAKAWIKQKL
jgi:RNA polymerase sigma factor (TIGR02999 family)